MARRKQSGGAARTRSPKATAPLKPVAAPPQVRRRRKRAHGIMKAGTILENPSQLEQRAPLLRKANRRLA